MNWVELITIEEMFLLPSGVGNMLVLSPRLPRPKGRTLFKKHQNAECLILKPDGQEMKANLVIAMTHLKIPNPEVTLEERWPITLWLTDKTIAEVPVSSKVFISAELFDSLWK